MGLMGSHSTEYLVLQDGTWVRPHPMQIDRERQLVAQKMRLCWERAPEFQTGSFFPNQDQAPIVTPRKSGPQTRCTWVMAVSWELQLPSILHEGQLRWESRF